MALPTNTLATYEAIGNREDLSEMVLSNLSPRYAVLQCDRQGEGDRHVP